MSRWALSQNAERPPSVRTDAWDGFCEVLKCLDNAAAGIANAGKLFTDIYERQCDRLVANAPAPIRRTLGYTRNVGKGLLIPQLATASGVHVSRLRAFPVVDQERFLHDPLEIVVKSGGEWDVLRGRVADMDSTTIKQVFAGDGRKWLRKDVDQQKAWITQEELRESKKEHSAVINRPSRLMVDVGRVFLAAAKVKAGLTKVDLEKLLSDLDQ